MNVQHTIRVVIYNGIDVFISCNMKCLLLKCLVVNRTLQCTLICTRRVYAIQFETCMLKLNKLLRDRCGRADVQVAFYILPLLFFT